MLNKPSERSAPLSLDLMGLTDTYYCVRSVTYMIYKCPKNNKDCEKCLFEPICYDCDEIRNAVSQVDIPRAVYVPYEEKNE